MNTYEDMLNDWLSYDCPIRHVRNVTLTQVYWETECLSEEIRSVLFCKEGVVYGFSSGGSVRAFLRYHFWRLESVGLRFIDDGVRLITWKNRKWVELERV